MFVNPKPPQEEEDVELLYEEVDEDEDEDDDKVGYGSNATGPCQSATDSIDTRYSFIRIHSNSFEFIRTGYSTAKYS